MQERVEENVRKHELVDELNKYVGESVQDILDDEKEFFELDTVDKRKVPPFTKVKRIPRDYTKENERKQRQDSSAQKSKSKEAAPRP